MHITDPATLLSLYPTLKDVREHHDYPQALVDNLRALLVLAACEPSDVDVQVRLRPDDRDGEKMLFSVGLTCVRYPGQPDEIEGGDLIRRLGERGVTKIITLPKDSAGIAHTVVCGVLKTTVGTISEVQFYNRAANPFKLAAWSKRQLERDIVVDSERKGRASKM